MSRETPGAVTNAVTHGAARFERDPATWFGYFTFAYAFFLISGFGPAMPFIRERLDLTYTLAGIHFSAGSLGMVSGGIAGDRIVRWAGRGRTVWIGLAAITLGSLSMMFSPTMLLTLPSAFLCGISGMTMAIAVQSDLTERHGEKRGTAIAEANVAASLGAIASTLLIGAFAGTSVGWAGGYGLLMVAGAAVALTLRDVKLRDGVRVAARRSARMSRRFWILATVNALSAATEWCVAYWGTEFLHISTGVASGTAASLMSLFFIAMVIGRLSGARLARVIPSLTMLVGSFALCLGGFLLFWLGSTLSLMLAGLLIFGLGTANVYPAAATYATGLLPQALDVVFARLMLVSSSAILVTPQILGALSDRIGIERSFGITPPLLLLGLALAVALRQTDQKPR